LPTAAAKKRGVLETRETPQDVKKDRTFNFGPIVRKDRSGGKGCKGAYGEKMRAFQKKQCNEKRDSPVGTG